MSLCWLLDTLDPINHSKRPWDIFDQHIQKECTKMAVVVSNLQGLNPLPQNLPKNEFTEMVEKLPQNMLNF